MDPSAQTRSSLGGAAVGVRRRPLTATQLRAAELLRRGGSQREVAGMVGRSERTIRSWLHNLDAFREAAQADGDEAGDDPDARETLRLALNATRSDGNPDWSVRVRAARALMAAGEPAPVPIVSVPPGAMVVYSEALDQIAGEG